MASGIRIENMYMKEICVTYGIPKIMVQTLVDFLCVQINVFISIRLVVYTDLYF